MRDPPVVATCPEAARSTRCDRLGAVAGARAGARVGGTVGPPGRPNCPARHQSRAG
ncbi:hypothetical protein [Lysobacter gummosus]|uniref:hypothetical protein n=1 Tax=Lysobacter gummosus TaxID=262324 RepID=UPI0036357988